MKKHVLRSLAIRSEAVKNAGRKLNFVEVQNITYEKEVSPQSDRSDSSLDLEGKEGVIAISQSPALTNLSSLNLGRNNIGDGGKKSIKSKQDAGQT